MADSYNVGAVKLTETFKPSYPVDQSIISEMKRYLDGIFANIEKYDIIDCACIGVGGTVVSLAALDQGLTVYDSRLINDYRLTVGRVAELLFICLIHLGANKQLKLYKKRADIIAQGTFIL